MDILDALVKWVAEQEDYILKHGISINKQQMQYAGMAGVKNADKIKVFPVKQIPSPKDPELNAVIKKAGFISRNTLAITFRYGIYIRQELFNNRKILIHEFAHTAQYERYGSPENFLKQYLFEILTYGYKDSPLESEAVKMEELLK